MFEEKVIELENEALKIFKKCYKLFVDKKDELFKLCHTRQLFSKRIKTVINSGDDPLIDKA